MADLEAQLTALFAEQFVVTKVGTEDPNAAAARAVMDLLRKQWDETSGWLYGRIATAAEEENRCG